MARYSHFLGRSVVVQYRAGDMVLPASGTFVADSGRSIFLEQQFEQRGQHKHFRWEIPYQCVVRLEEKRHEQGAEYPGAEAGGAPDAASRATPKDSTQETATEPPRASAAVVGGSSTGMMSMPHRPKPA